MQVEKQKLVYIAAASHSGSTMTAMLLGAHPDLCSVGELKAIHLGDTNQYLCSCDSKILECEFWSGVTQKMAKKGHDFGIENAQMDIRSNATPYVQKLLKPLVRGRLLEYVRDFSLSLSPHWRRNLKWLQKRNVDYISSIAEQAGVSTVVDSSKIGIRLKYLLKNPALDIKVVWVVRNGKGVSLAYKKPSEYADAQDPQKRGGGTGRTQEQSRDIEVGAKEWVKCNKETQALLNTIPDSQWMKVHYEDLCLDTEGTLDSIFTFIGVDPDKKRLDFKSVEHHVVGNGMRLDKSDAIRLDERWKSDLTNTDLDSFNFIAGKYSQLLGYND